VGRTFGFGPSDTERFEGLQEESSGLGVPEGEELETFEFRRKFVSGLFYCGGKKRQFFGLTFEQNGTIRENELLDAIERDTDRECSEIRDNFGYSDDEVDRSEVRTGAIWPDIEVGEL
jgi:hypothetical protein